MADSVVAFVVSLLAAYGVFLVFTSTVLGWRGIGVSESIGRHRRGVRVSDLLVQAGFERIGVAEFAAVEVVLWAVGSAVGFAFYGGLLPAATVGAVVAALPIASARNRRRARLRKSREHWPRMIEEIRLQTVTLGRSIPQAVLTVGLVGPDEMRPAFRAAHREWLMSTDFDRMLATIKLHLADPTADAVCETLLIAHEVGGSDVDQRLRALAEDRSEDLQGRKDTVAKQAGVRFARNFVVVVPVGMGLVGSGIGDGRAAFATATGQIAVLVAFAMMAGCWAWAGQLLRLPEQPRVFVPVAPNGSRAADDVASAST